MLIRNATLIVSLFLAFYSQSTWAVTSVSKTSEDSFESSAAVYIITRKDIERSGATTISEVLRMVPGLHVARMASDQWGVASRGFNMQFVNKLLVMIDGRDIYTPLFSGVYWGMQDTLIENIKQIEVIRGPGATQWGANAVNGVINIITEPAINTQSELLSMTYGGEEKGSVAVRTGGKIKENSYYRLYAKHYSRDNLRDMDGDNMHNDWEVSRGGFRIDYDESEKDFLTLHGNVYSGETNLDLYLPTTTTKERLLDDLGIYGVNITSNWKHLLDNDAETELQFYYDEAIRKYTILDRKMKIFDIDFQYAKNFKNHKLLSGVNYRRVTSHLNGNSFRLNFDPANSSSNLYSAFLQDKITLLPESLYLTLGSKFEHNDFTGYEIQPSAKIAWLATQDQTLWASISKAVRTPSIAEDSINLITDYDNITGTYKRQQGDTNYDSETLIAYEVGYRIRPTKNTLFDATVFYNDYNDLRSAEYKGRTPESQGKFDTVFPQNNGEASAFGFELDSSWKPYRRWQLKAGYSFLKLDVDAKAGSTEYGELEKEEDRSPRHQFSIHSRLDLPYNIEFDNSLYYVDSIMVEDNNSQTVKIPSYFRFDTHIGWKYSESISFDLVGQNLLDDLHPEFSGRLWAKSVQVGRSVYGKVTIKF